MKKASKKTQTDYKKYGTDAFLAWDSYRARGDTRELLPVIGDRLRIMRPELVETIYTFTLVFSQK